MIVVDTSALMAIVLDEAEAERCSDVIANTERVIMSAATFAETLIVALRKGSAADMAAFVRDLEIEIEPVTQALALLAGEAYRAWGKSRHPANLNFGDCFSYALAKDLNCRLLFVGNDFAKTDISPA